MIERTGKSCSLMSASNQEPEEAHSYKTHRLIKSQGGTQLQNLPN